MHRLIVTSSTYRQSSFVVNETASAADPLNDLWWRYEQRRLDAEAIRDSVLTASGRLNNELYGLPIFPPLPGDIAETVKYSENKWDTQVGHEGRKRSIYIYQQRTLNMPFMQAFDSKRVLREAGRSVPEQIRLAYRYTLSRPPSPEEAKHFGDLLGQAEDPAAALGVAHAASSKETASRNARGCFSCSSRLQECRGKYGSNRNFRLSAAWRPRGSA